MATKQLNTKIITCNDSQLNWASSTKVLLKGEIAIEIPASGTPKFKIGDGSSVFSALPYATMTPTEISSAIGSASHTHANKDILDAITAAFTTEKDTKLTGIATGAQVNVIEDVKVNGTSLTVSGKAVDVTVPTKVSELTNDTGYITSYVDTTYDLAATKGSSNGSVKIQLTDSKSPAGVDEVAIQGAGGATVTTDADGVITVTSSTYTHPTSGVTAGTYKSVTVDENGHVTAGTNPTTLAGYGITDAASSTHSHAFSEITGSLNLASQVTGVLSIDHIPQGALERLCIVADQAARLALTTADVQNGDVVKEASSGLMFFVKDQTKLGTADAAEAFEAFTAGSASSVPWSGVIDKPSVFTPDEHTHTKSEITDFSDADYATAAQGATADTAVQSVKITGDTTEYKNGTSVTLPAYPTTLPASDVPSWAKAATKPTYTAAEVGLGNVDNVKQIAGLASGTTQNHVVVFGADGYTVADSGFTIGKSVPSDAVFTDTTYNVMTGASASTAGASGLVPTPAAGDDSKFLSGDGTWKEVDVADEKVKSEVAATTLGYLVASTSDTTSTGTLIKDTGVYLDTTAGKLVATTFAGALVGNASTATALVNPRNFSITGGATAEAVSFNGTDNVALNVTSLDATKLNLASGDVLILNGGDAEVAA